MSWVRRHEETEQHSCITPGHSGTLGDLWRCDDCQQLWRLADACNWCDRNGSQSHAGQCMVGRVWRPATWWQRVANRRKGRDIPRTDDQRWRARTGRAPSRTDDP